MDNHLMNHDNERELFQAFVTLEQIHTGPLFALNVSLSQVVRYQNTYRLEAYNPFKVDPVDKIIETIMTSRLDDVSYDATESVQVCQSVATDIREKIKKLNFDRHKIVVNVTIIEKANQSIESSVGFLWDTERDNYSTFTYEARNFHAYCSVFGLYYE